MHLMLPEGKLIVALLQITESDGSQNIYVKPVAEAEQSSFSSHQKCNFLFQHR